ncbi:hypothetical protein HK098_004957 [Nowakowskiella sp. JEL0407]|nr:hypothetical protein HK098_004957 [Nowakowskiella sp. JEL0407]
MEQNNVIVLDTDISSSRIKYSKHVPSHPSLSSDDILHSDSESKPIPRRRNQSEFITGSQDTNTDLSIPATPFRKSYRSTSAGNITSGFKAPTFKSNGGFNASSAISDSEEVSRRRVLKQQQADSLSSVSQTNSGTSPVVATPGQRYRSASSRSGKSGFTFLSKKSNFDTDHGELYSDTDRDDSVVDDERFGIPKLKPAVREKKNKELHKLFRSLDTSEEYITDFQCALQKDILIQGKLYFTPCNICFHANIFGFVTTLIIPFIDIIKIEKKMTALIIPNAIAITTNLTQYTFTSFMGREQCFALLEELWRQNKADEYQLQEADYDIEKRNEDEDVYDYDQYGENYSEDDVSFDGQYVVSKGRDLIPVSMDGMTVVGTSSFGKEVRNTANDSSFDKITDMVNDFISPLYSDHPSNATFFSAPVTYLTGITANPPQQMNRYKGDRSISKIPKSTRKNDQQILVVLILFVCIIMCFLMAFASMMVLWRVRGIVGKIEDLAVLVVGQKTATSL